MFHGMFYRLLERDWLANERFPAVVRLPKCCVYEYNVWELKSVVVVVVVVVVIIKIRNRFRGNKDVAFRVIIIIITRRRRFLACGGMYARACVYTERLFYHEVDHVLARKHRPTPLSQTTAFL